jgi:hypothetical protein
MKLVGERRALAAAIMAFYTLLYALFATSGVAPELTRVLAAIAGVYGLAFFALVAGYFWARWFAVGVGLYGVITAAVGIWQIGAEPVILFLGGTHLAATAFLWGHGMSEPYDGQTAWRERFHMDEGAVQRLGRSVIRAGVSLPLILVYALSPKPGGVALPWAVAAATAVALGLFGLRGMIRLKTWGVLAVGAAGALTLGLATTDLAAHGLHGAVLQAAVGGSGLVLAFLPFGSSIARFIAAR